MAPEPGALQKLESRTTEHSVGTQALRPKAGSYQGSRLNVQIAHLLKMLVKR
jgi:hypothetical protein